MRRRDFLRLLLASPLAATVDVEQLLWTPKPIIVVPAMPRTGTIGAIDRATFSFWRNSSIVTAAWEEYVKATPEDNLLTRFHLLRGLGGHTNH